MKTRTFHANTPGREPSVRSTGAATGARSGNGNGSLRRPLLPPQEPTDWIESFIASDAEAVVRMLWRILGREEDVLDAYQECLCRLAALNRDHVRNVRAYAFRTAANIALEMLRVRRRHEARKREVWEVRGDRSTVPAPSPVELHEGEWALDRLREAVADLPPHLRHVVVLRDLSGLSYEEIAGILNIEPTTARVYRRHAVVKLAERLGGNGTAGGPA